MGSAAEVVVDSFGSSILVDVAIHAGGEAGGSVYILLDTQLNVLKCLARSQITT
jgi:hypothetical protein